MKKWVADTIAADKKKALPVLSFPAIQKMGITVAELINSSDKQAEAMKIIADSFPTAASLSLMDLSLEAEAFGSTIRVSDDEVPTVIGSIVDDEESADALKIPAIGTGRTQIYIDAVKKAKKLITDRPVIAGTIGPFSLAGRLLDVSEALVYCYDEPDMVHTVLDKCAEFLIGYMLEYKKAGADGICMAEPLAGLLSPDLAEEFSAQYVRKIVDAVQDDEFIIVYHNCGNTAVQTVETIDTNGAPVFHFGNAIDMADMMPHISANNIAMGNVSPAGEFRNGTPESIYAATTEVLKKCSKFPNFVISSGCDIPPMSPWENIESFFKAVADFYA
ncbi:MAG: uroporphyrinogen decarboxylase family protein [Lachnospiraceae bacterium]|nr:uroporphyrinogen decarboxylase family protein [Lachnospiraceae bacterium]